MSVHVYANGIVTCSVCAPSDMPLDDVTRELNGINPTGIPSPWRVSLDENFVTGQPHPRACELDPGRVHYLFHC